MNNQSDSRRPDKSAGRHFQRRHIYVVFVIGPSFIPERNGTRHIFPYKFEPYKDHIPEEERSDYKRLIDRWIFLIADVYARHHKDYFHDF